MVKAIAFQNFQNTSILPSYNSRKSVSYLPYKKNVDSVSFTSNSLDKSYNIGDRIKHLGLVIEKPKIFNKTTERMEKSYITYKNAGQFGTFKLIKDDPAKIERLSGLIDENPEIADILKRHKFKVTKYSTPQIRSVNPEAMDLFDDLIIAEISHVGISEKNKEIITKKMGYPGDPNADFIEIDNYIKKQKNYPQSSILIAIPLIKALKQSGYSNIIVRARSFIEGSKSPVELYLRNGFVPFKRTMEDIENHKLETPDGKVVDPDYEVPMYLPEDASIYNDVKKVPMLREINKIEPDWFMKE